MALLWAKAEWKVPINKNKAIITILTFINGLEKIWDVHKSIKNAEGFSTFGIILLTEVA